MMSHFFVLFHPHTHFVPFPSHSLVTSHNFKGFFFQCNFAIVTTFVYHIFHWYELSKSANPVLEHREFHVSVSKQAFVTLTDVLKQIKQAHPTYVARVLFHLSLFCVIQASNYDFWFDEIIEN